MGSVCSCEESQSRAKPDPKKKPSKLDRSGLMSGSSSDASGEPDGYQHFRDDSDSEVSAVFDSDEERADRTRYRMSIVVAKGLGSLRGSEQQYSEEERQIIECFKEAVTDDNSALLELWLADAPPSLDLLNHVWESDPRSTEDRCDDGSQRSAQKQREKLKEQRMREAGLIGGGRKNRGKKHSVSGMNCLMYAISKEKKECTAYLLNTDGIDLDYRCKSNGFTALHFAVDCQPTNVSLIELLLFQGSNMRLRDNQGRTVLTLAKQMQAEGVEVHPTVMELLNSDRREEMIEEESESESSSSPSAGAASSEDELLDTSQVMAIVGSGSSRVMLATAPSQDAAGSESTGKGDSRALRKAKEKHLRHKTDLEELGSGLHLEAAEEAIKSAEREEIEQTESLLEDLKQHVAPDTTSKSRRGRRFGPRKTTVKRTQLHTIFLERSKLPKLAAFLDKKKAKGPHGYQRRWVIVKDGHCVWSSKQQELLNANDPRERAKFNGQLYLLYVKVNPVDTTAQNKFEIVGINPKTKAEKKYVFKARNQTERDFWVDGVTAHHNYVRDMIAYLQKSQ